ncbi:hypothetical protein ACFX2I_014377 [Malus domestica]
MAEKRTNSQQGLSQRIPSRLGLKEHQDVVSSCSSFTPLPLPSSSVPRRGTRTSSHVAGPGNFLVAEVLFCDLRNPGERGSGNKGSGAGSGHGGVEKGPELGVAGVQGHGGRTAEYPLLEELRLKRMRVWRCWVFVLVGSKPFRLSAVMGSILMEIVFHKNNNNTIYPV